MKESIKELKEILENYESKSVIAAIKAILHKDRSYELSLRLIWSYLAKSCITHSKEEETELLVKAGSLLESVREDGKDDPLWHRYFSMVCRDLYANEEEALSHSRIAEKLASGDQSV